MQYDKLMRQIKSAFADAPLIFIETRVDEYDQEYVKKAKSLWLPVT
jgi:hypothetical protein